MSKLKELEELCNDRNFNKNHLCIVGSYILELLGIRKANDIDFILKKKDRSSIEGKKLSKNCELVKPSWHPTISDDEIIDNNKYHFVTDSGFKVIKLQLLIDRKKYQNRKKDKRDIILIDKFRSSNSIFK